MKPGIINFCGVDVNFPPHFIKRYEKDEPNRPAVVRVAPEARIGRMILEALPRITAWTTDEGGFRGTIRSRSLKVNLGFASGIDSRRRVSLIVLTAMVNEKFVPQKGDRLVEVNPRLKIWFIEKMDRDLKSAVVDHLRSVMNKIPVGGGGWKETDEMAYYAVREKDYIAIECAQWNHDMVAVDVS